MFPEWEPADSRSVSGMVIIVHDVRYLSSQEMIIPTAQTPAPSSYKII